MNNDLRQIKWLLAGILACLVIITFAMVPQLFSLVLITAIAYAAAMILLSASLTARSVFSQTWLQISSLWRR
jgi:hypothetical protein